MSEDIIGGHVLSRTVGTAEALTVWADLCELLGHQSSQNGRVVEVSIIQKLGWETKTSEICMLFPVAIVQRALSRTQLLPLR